LAHHLRPADNTRSRSEAVRCFVYVSSYSFNSSIRRAQSSVITYFRFRSTAAYS